MQRSNPCYRPRERPLRQRRNQNCCLNGSSYLNHSSRNNDILTVSKQPAVWRRGKCRELPDEHRIRAESRQGCAHLLDWAPSRRVWNLTHVVCNRGGYFSHQG
jgi:hypothetical protein